jgi:hypothetical protein
MGLIHSRASKKRDKAQAKLLEEERRQLAAPRLEAERAARRERAGDNPLRQTTVRDMGAATLRQLRKPR